MEDLKNEVSSDKLLELNHELNSLLTTTKPPSETFGYFLKTCCKIIGIDAGAIYLKDRFTDGLRLESYKGFNSKIPNSIYRYDFSSLESRLVMLGKPIYSPFPLEGKEIFASHEILQQGFVYICIIPVLYDSTVLAATIFFSKTIKDINHSIKLTLEAFTMRVGANIARVNAVMALQENEERYKSLLETMNEGFLIIDKNHKITYGNNRICEMLGYQIDEILGLPVDYFLDENNRTIFEKQTQRRGRKGNLSYEISWVKADSTSITTRVAPKAILNKTGKFIGSFAVLTDITAIVETSRMLKNKEIALLEKTKSLQDVNTALKVLLKKREEDKSELEDRVLSNTKRLIIPILEKIRNRQLNENLQPLFDILESNVDNITSSFSKSLFSNQLFLTTTELEIANFIRDGRNTKEIADILNLSTRTIETHRFRIRKKLQLSSKKINLRTYLLSLQ